MMYLKQSPSVGNAFTNCFMRPSFMSRGENITSFLSTSGSCSMLGTPSLRSSDLGGQFVSSNASLKLCYTTYRESMDTLCTHVADQEGSTPF